MDFGNRFVRLWRRRLAFALMACVGAACIHGSLTADFSRGKSGQRNDLFEQYLMRGFLFMVGLFPLLYLWRPGDYSKRMAGPMDRLAKSLGGRLEHDGVLDPVQSFSWKRADIYATQTAWLDDFQMEGKNKTPPAAARWVFRCRYDLPPRTPLRVEIRPESPADFLAKLLGMQDLQIGNRELDRRYIMQSSDPPAFAALARSGFEAALDRTVRIRPDCDLLHVSLVPGRLVVQRSFKVVWSQPDEQTIPLAFHDTTLDLLFAITGLSPFGRADQIQTAIMEVGAAGPIACLVCGADIEREMMVCLRCDTPHHADCWTYNGRCGLYACNSVKARHGRRKVA